MHLKAIDIKERLLGPEDYEVALSVGHLASLYNYDMQKYMEAAQLYQRSIAIGKIIIIIIVSITILITNIIIRNTDFMWQKFEFKFASIIFMRSLNFIVQVQSITNFYFLSVGFMRITSLCTL